MDELGIHRPRNVDWKRAAALLYGDWGTSKAYVIGLAFFFAGYSSLPIIVAVCCLTALVGYNYVIVCKHFPDGGGVYSAARNQSRLLAVVGALLLVANFIVTAALSCWSAMSYFGVPPEYVGKATMAVILFIGAINYFGPKHTGSLAVWLAAPTVAVVLLIVGMSLPHLTTVNLEPLQGGFRPNWSHFVGMILALSGVEAIANLTGVMKLNPGASMDQPDVSATARKAIFPVAVEVVLGTILLGWAMLSLPKDMAPDPVAQRDYMMRFVAEQYGTWMLGTGVGKVIGLVVGVVVGLLLVSAVNTAIAAQIGLVYMLTKDGEMPRSLGRLNQHGVPRWPLALATLAPVVVVAFSHDIEVLARMYAIGVVGAITVNLGSCTFNRNLGVRWHERMIMGITFLILFAVELTIAKTNGDALFFAICVVGLGLGVRGYAQRRAGLRTVTVSQEIAAHVAPEAEAAELPIGESVGKTIMVAARGINPVLRFALEEAKLRQSPLYVLYVKEVAVNLPGPVVSSERPRWQDDKLAAKIMYTMLTRAKQKGIQVVPLYAVSDAPAQTILDLAAITGVDILLLGASHRRTLSQLLKGDVITEVARNLPENIQLLIHG